METSQKLLLLRETMEKKHLAAVVIPSSDPHMSEYLPDYWKTRAFVSGFTGSAGTLAVTLTKAGLWTDGRYYVQAQKQMEGSGIQLFRAADPGCPSVHQYLADMLPEGSVVGINGLIFSQETIEEMEEAFTNRGISLDMRADLANEIWADRPAPSLSQAFLLDTCFSGRTASDKISDLRQRLGHHSADAVVISKLDSIAWLFNIRGNDINFAPVITAYALVTPEEAILFTELNRLPEEVRENLAKNRVTLRPYEDIFPYLSTLKSQLTCLCDKKEINGLLHRSIRQNSRISLVYGENPVSFMKAVKNEREIEGTQNVYFKDGCALAEMYAELFEEVEGEGQLPTEYDLTLRLEHYRRRQPDFIEDSFAPIVCYKANAAMMHYSPKKDQSARLERSGMLLIDSGAHYMNGTTDITRTFALGPLTDEEKTDFTLALKGFIALTNAVFKDGMTGKELDILCREPLWKHGLDYRCGTGHGVGFVLNIHEGPQGFGAANAANTYPLHENMIVTIEPGVYKEGLHGVRTENVVRIAKAFQTEYGDFLKFETFTLVPIDTACIAKELLAPEELQWLNDYNTQVSQTLSPHVTPKAQAWLQKVCRPIT